MQKDVSILEERMHLQIISYDNVERLKATRVLECAKKQEANKICQAVRIDKRTIILKRVKK